MKIRVWEYGIELVTCASCLSMIFTKCGKGSAADDEVDVEWLALNGRIRVQVGSCITESDW